MLKALKRFLTIPVVDESGGFNSGGHSLVEMAIVITIMGVVVGMGLPVYQQHVLQEKMAQTRENQEVVFQALASYVLQHRTFPCPSAPEDPDKRGYSRKSCTDHPVGLLPYRELGLPEKLSKDGFGRFFTYAVAPDVLDQPFSIEEDDRSFSNLLKQDMKGLLVEDRPDHHLIYEENTTNPIIFLLISHGSCGHGTYLSHPGVAGNQLNASDPGTGEVLNADHKTLRFADYPYSTHPDNPFRHIVKWATVSSLIGGYGKSPHLLISPKEEAPKGSGGL